jgi:hypothetical protein
MATLMFACPNTRQFIKTGIETDAYTLTCLRPIRMRVRCSHCGIEHALPMKYGFLAEPPPRPAEPDLSLPATS